MIPDDPLADLLSPRPAPANDLVQRAILRERTTQQLETLARRRRTMRFAARTLAIGFAFAMGVVCRPWLIPTPEAVPMVTIEYVAVRVEPPTIVEPPKAVEPEPAPPVVRTPYQWEIQAELSDDHAEAARCYRLAGDGYLAQTELPAAARCYRSALEAAGPNAWRIEPDDSWLLISMKNAQTPGETDR